jgi:ribosome biogenesis GTPase / thiamine phosphate phosphatase
VSDTFQLEGIVLDGTGGAWHVRLTDGDTVTAALRGRVKNASQLKLAVGDRVMVERGAGSASWAIGEILPRRSQLSRQEPGGRYGERVLVANIDQVVIVLAAAQPEPNLRMLDRFLVIAEANGLHPRLVVNKLDLVDEAAVVARFAEYERAGYAMLLTSVKLDRGIATLRSEMDEKISVFTGPSGVGKSSLLNAMYPGLSLRVSEISVAVQKGRHTTVGSSLHALPDGAGGYVVDTPGLREVGIWNVPPAELPACFPEFRPYLEQCRFTDCTHVVEPDCAVREAVESGAIGRGRYQSYLRLRSEVEESERMLAPYGRRPTRER